MKASVIQMNSSDDVARNVDTAARLVEACMNSDNPDMVALPEYFSCIAAGQEQMRAGAERVASHDIPGFLADMARRHGITVHAGSSLSLQDGRIFNESLVFGPDGECVARYRKIHLFDTVLPDGSRIFESDTVCRGDSISLYDCCGLRFGASICFDIRFPELYARLVARGAQVLLAPSAFTFATGADHWEILLRARAIETQCYMLAPAQIFSFGGGKYQNWGHSMIIDPWGTIVAQASMQEGFASAVLHPSLVSSVRARLPVATNRYWSTPG